MNPKFDLTRKSDRDLLAELPSLVSQENQTKADVIAAMAELDDRKLYLGEAFSSMFNYCLKVLHLPEGTTCRRIQTARTARRYPIIFEMLANGEIHPTGVQLLAARLTPENHLELLRAARHKSKREIELLLSEWFPKPSVKDTIRKLPAPRVESDSGIGDLRAVEPSEGRTRDLESRAHALPTTATSGSSPPPTFELSAPPAQRGTVTPLAPQRFKIELTADQELHDMVRQAQDLTRHQNRSGDLSVLFKKAMRFLLDDVKRKQFGATKSRKVSTRSQNEPSAKPASDADNGAGASRYVPAAVRRKVVERDGWRCAFVSADGRCCEETGFLQFQHRQPFARGGSATEENLCLLCAAHNQHAAECDFGKDLMARRREERIRSGGSAESQGASAEHSLARGEPQREDPSGPPSPG